MPLSRTVFACSLVIGCAIGATASSCVTDLSWQASAGRVVVMRDNCVLHGTNPDFLLSLIFSFPLAHYHLLFQTEHPPV
jgi:hypothetical protein